MKRADIHLVDVRHDSSVGQFIRDSCNQFLGGLLRESGNEDAFGLHAAFLYEIDGALNERIGLAGSGTCRDKDGTVCGCYRLSLSLVLSH